MATPAFDAVCVGSADGRFSHWRAVLNAHFIAAWDDLATEAAEPNAFAESWFLQPALEQFDPGGKVKLFTLWNGPNLCGLMPVSEHVRYGRWAVPHVQNWLHHNAFLGTPLVRKGYEREFWQAYLEGLDRAPGSALFAHVNGVTIGGPLDQALASICAEQSRSCTLVHRIDRAFLEYNLSSEAYINTEIRGKKRKELRRLQNRLSEQGVLTFTRDVSVEKLDEWAHEFLTLEARGWKGRRGSALDSDGATRAFFKAILPGAAKAGKLERLEMRLDGRPLVMLVNFLCPPGAFSFKTAFDEDYARFSPGVLLQIENLASLDNPDIAWADSCAAEGHPMIDSLWTGRRSIGRYSVAIGGSGRRAIFQTLLKMELARNRRRIRKQQKAGED